MNFLAYKYRIYPSEEQKQYFMKTFGCVRLVYNRCLEMERDTLQVGDPPLGKKELMSYVSSVLLNEYPFLKNVDFNALCHAASNLFQAYQRYWNNVSNPPAFKSRRTSRNSFMIGAGVHQLEVGTNYIFISDVGRVKAVIHRPLPESARIYSFTISQEPDDSFYCSVLFSYNLVVSRQQCDLKNSIGLDYCAKGLFTDSNGNECNAPRYNKESEKQLARAQRKLDRMVGGSKDEKPSKNYLKQRMKVNRIYRKIVNRRNDFLHKRTSELTSQYDLISVEGLNMSEMAAHGQGHGKSTMDNAYGRFLELLDYKARNKGKYLVKIDRWFPSSQICSYCGYRQKLNLNQRVFYCPRCGLDIDRDYNAAINIKREGMRIVHDGRPTKA